ncbi:MAG TPA: hypothetical protein VJ764_00645 [Steroidobacteraceae bacterium]|nr:hypothetical protein [Steroidobacteraceae bacterium]
MAPPEITFGTRIGNETLIEEKVMSTRNGIRRFASAATLATALAASATLADAVHSSSAPRVADLGQITVLARRDTPVADLGSLVVSARRLPPSFADLGAVTVTAKRIGTVMVASPAPRRS